MSSHGSRHFSSRNWLRPRLIIISLLYRRLEHFHQLKGRRWTSKGEETPLKAHGRPWRVRAILFVLLSTGLRRQELIELDLDQLIPNTPEELRRVRRAQITRVQEKGQTERTVFLSADARMALADYLEKERPQDTIDGTKALFLSAKGLPARKPDGRLSARALNFTLEQIRH